MVEARGSNPLRSTGSVRMDDVKKLALAVLAVMVLSMAGMAVNGINQGFGLMLLAVFSVTIAFTAVLFEGWSGEEE